MQQNIDIDVAISMAEDRDIPILDEGMNGEMIETGETQERCS